MKRIVLIVGLVASSSSAALADSAGPIQYEPPWPAAQAKAPGMVYDDPSSSAQIVVEGPYEASAAEAAAGSWPSGGKVESEAETAVAGQYGYLVIRKKGKQKIASAAVVVDGAAYVFSLVAKKADFDGAIEAWGTMVDNAWVGAAAETTAWEPTYEQPAGGYTVTMQNAESDCSSKVTIDGQGYTLGPGETQSVELAAGFHTVGWQNRDGTSDSGSYEVPDLSSFSVSCKAGKQPKRAEPEEAAPAAGGSAHSADELAQAAYVWVRLYYTCLNFMSYSDLFGDGKPFTINGLQDRMAGAAADNEQVANMLFAAYGSEQDLVDKWNAGGDAEHYQLMRAAAQFALDVATDAGLVNIWGDHGCAGADDPIGCWVDASVGVANAYYAAKEANDKAAMTRALMIESSTSTFIFNSTMNVMPFTPVSW